MYSCGSYLSLLPNEDELSFSQLEFVASTHKWQVTLISFFFSFFSGILFWVVWVWFFFLTNNYRKLRGPCNSEIFFSAAQSSFMQSLLLWFPIGSFLTQWVLGRSQTDLVPFLRSKERQLALSEELVLQLINGITSANSNLSAELGHFFHEDLERENLFSRCISASANLHHLRVPWMERFVNTETYTGVGSLLVCFESRPFYL